MEDLLKCKRFVTSEWHRNQAENLLNFALKNDSDNALIYSILESRIALERYVFEMSVLVKGNKLTNENLKSADRRNGVFNLLKETMVDYIKHLTFSNIILVINNIPERINIPNLKRFKQLITELSNFCHLQFKPIETIYDPKKKWFIKGVSLVQETISILKSSNLEGAMEIESMENEVLDVYNKFLQSKIDIKAVRIQLKLMSPVLEIRKSIKV